MQGQPPNSNGSLAQRRPVSPSRPTLGRADQLPLALSAPPHLQTGTGSRKDVSTKAWER